MSGIDIPEEYLAQMWEEINWKASEEKLKELQRRLTIAVFKKNDKEVQDTQKRIVRDIDIKCLAVRHVCREKTSPGVDGVRWKTSAEKMSAAMSLTSRGYHAKPLRQILIKAKNTGKERRQGIPTYYDRAMNVLYGYSLSPVLEATGERKSFAFRPCRSTQDAHAYVFEAIKGKDAPEYIVCADIKAYYAHIQHSWLLEHVPMDKKVLGEFLNAGIVFAGEMFPADGTGISEGANLSPLLGNFVLDGMQKYLYECLYGTEHPEDYADGNLIRYADDVLVTVRTQETGEMVIKYLSAFLAERGLMLSAEKTHICKITDGFTFLSRTYKRQNGVIYTCPSDAAVSRFIDDLCLTIMSNKRSQRNLIDLLNRKLKGWANYHRYSDARDAFRQVDAAVQTALLDAAIEKHPKMALAKIIEKYWYREADGRYYYCLPDDKSVRVVKIVDTLLLVHRKVKTNVNPYVEDEYTQARVENRDMQNVTGKYRAIWERQEGICYYCGRPILPDQQRTTVTLDLTRKPSVRNSAYIHKMCAANEFQVVQTMEDISLLHPYDVERILQKISNAKLTNAPKPITPEWKHYKLKEYFAKCTASSVTLTFAEIEKIEKKPLPKTARTDRHWWYHKNRENGICEAWRTEGYSLKRLQFEKEKITLKRNASGVSRLTIPDVLLQGRLPDNAVYELEHYMEYIINKYGLMK